MKFEKLTELIDERITGEWGQEPNSSRVKVIRTTNFTNEGTLDLSNVVERDVEEKKIENKALKKGDIIIEKSGGGPTQPVGRVVYFDIDSDEKYLCNNFTSILRPKSSIVQSKYLFYQMLYLHKTGRTKKYQNKTTGIHNLILEKYLQEKIPLPPLPAQRHIANILSQAERLISQRKESLRLLDEYLKSTFLEMFGDPVRNEKGWKINSLSKFGSLKNGLNYTRKEEGISVRCLGVGDFKDLYKMTDLSSLQILNLSTLPSADYFLKEGDIVFVRSNGNRELVGRCLLVFPNSEKVSFSGFCIRYRIEKEGINPIFLAHLFRVPIFRTYMLYGGRGANIQNINQQTLERLKIPFPPFSLQTHFAQIVEKTEALKAEYRKSLEELEQLYGSLSQRAFRGEMEG